MRIIDAFTGRDVKVGDTLPLPGGGWVRVVEMSPGPALRALNAIGYAVAGVGLVAPKVRLESSMPALHGQWVPLAVRTDHPSYPRETIAFIPS